MTDEEAILSAIAEYADLIDDGRLDEWVREADRWRIRTRRIALKS